MTTIKGYQFSTEYEGIYAPLNYVYYSQVASVRQLITNALKLPAIKTIILFGSSITLGCGIDSDIDVLIISDAYDEDYSLLRQDIKQPMDMIPETLEHFKASVKEGNSLYKEVLQKGLIIYERSSKACKI